MNRKALIITSTLVVVLGSLAGAAWLNADRSVEPATTGAAAPPPALGRTAVIAAPGRVEPVSEEVDIRSELPGRLARVLVEEGDVVEAGQILAALDNADYEARVRSAQARLDVARADLLRLMNGARTEERREAAAALNQARAVLTQAELEERRRENLYADGGIIAREELERAKRDREVSEARVRELEERLAFVSAEARADERLRSEAAVRLAEAQLAESEALLEKTRLRAPLAGVVLRTDHRPGEQVSPEDPAPIVTIADTTRLRVRVDVDEIDVASLVAGQSAWVTADAYRGSKFTGKVIRVGRMLGRKNIRTDEPTEKIDTKVLETLIELDPGVTLPVGLRVDAFIEAARQNR
jgi:HlyD family secretion protein